ncbi:tRNA threonylcarbamoyladenosine dehydratase [Desulfogranum japonicum]|uniref:tRNA threonylcarbamoyladenosine dehydratase n=1 Tax=Desulfogranum japonicum TaxID=231447 RepID=UPI000403BB29|nr:tRNA threonylcarbamoyladenosine dehydratase [Desulfogranum japonicum]
MERFLRTQRLLGEERFLRLQQAFVTVVGIGAVGGYVVEGLARAGVGRLRLVDFDLVQPSNINRQILATENTLHRPKVTVAKERVLSINPQAEVEALEVFAAEETLEHILSPRPDLVIDAIDSLNPKVHLLMESWKKNIPTISSMGAALRTDPGRICSGDLSETRNCPLARRVRKRLRKEGITNGIDCVFSTEEVNFTYTEPEHDHTEAVVSVHDDRGRTRRVLGSLPTLTGIFGLIIANRAILRLSQ